MFVTLDTSHLEMSPLNADALTNMLHMPVALDTSQLDMSPVNLLAPGTKSLLNNSLMSATAETSHDPIGPCGPLEQSVGDSCRHSLMAAWSSSSDLKASAVVKYYDMGFTLVGFRVKGRLMVRFGVQVRVNSE